MKAASSKTVKTKTTKPLKLEFNGLAKRTKVCRAQLSRAFRQVLNSGNFLNGPQNQKLEATLAEYFEVPYVKTVTSGHDALQMTFEALHLKRGSEVIVQANAYPSAFPVVMAGLTLKLADVNAEGQLGLEQLQKAVTPQTKVVLLTHLFGACGNVIEIAKFCEAHKLILIEDCAQAFGSRFQGQLLGTFGKVGCFSFYPTKNLGTLGDGGAIITHDQKLFEYCSQAAQYGESQRYQSNFVAGHSRLPELQAATLNIFFTDLVKIQKKRLRVRAQFEKSLKSLVKKGTVRFLQSDTLSQPFFHLLVMEAKQRDQLRADLQAKQIPTLLHYPLSLDQVPAFCNDQLHGPLPTARHLTSHCVSLPFHEYLKKSEIDYIVKAIKAFYGQNQTS